MIPKLEAESERLQRERQAKSEEIQRLVRAIAAIDNPPPSVTERLAELEGIVTRIGQRLRDIDSEVDGLDQNRVDPEAVTAALDEFDQMWEVIYPAEQVRLVRIPVEMV
jgi:septal ring factor EnvC (AmiA/AmiB activator)